MNDYKKRKQLVELKRKWSKLSLKDRKFVLEFYSILYPKKSELITEASWYNTLGDIVGIFDPTGIVDIVNGISYWRQGDRLYALLSWISAVPGLGDLIAKPVIATLKMGKGAIKAFTGAAKAGNPTAIAAAAKAAGGPIQKMVASAPSWGGKLMDALKALVGRVPFFGGGMVKVIDEYIEIFTKASDEMANIGKAEASMGRTLTSAERAEMMKQIKPFSGYKGATQGFAQKYISGGMGRLFGNRATRSLMRRTKFYLGFLDWLGIANFVGPDELETMYADAAKQMDEYSKTPEAKELWMKEFGDAPMPMEMPTPEAPKPSSGIDPISILLNIAGLNPMGVLK